MRADEIAPRPVRSDAGFDRATDARSCWLRDEGFLRLILPAVDALHAEMPGGTAGHLHDVVTGGNDDFGQAEAESCQVHAAGSGKLGRQV